jgi:hypothetical protein
MGNKVKPRMFVHIGMHKTGTSSIQLMLHRNLGSGQMRDFLYPVTGREGRWASQHLHLARAFRYPATPYKSSAVEETSDSFLERFLGELATFEGKHIVVSSEEFCLLSDDQVKSFGKTFEGFELVPVIYLRNLADYFEKYYQTMIQYDFLPQPDLRNPNFKFWEDLVEANAFEISRRWATIAYDGKVVVVDYDSRGNRGSAIDSVLTFLKLIGIDPSSVVLGKDLLTANKSQSTILTFLKVELTRRNVARHTIDELLGQLSSLSLGEHLTLVPPDARAKLDADYRNQRSDLASAEFLAVAKHFYENGDCQSDGSPFSKEFSRQGPAPIHIDGWSGLVLAVGRAIARTKIVP